MLEKLRVWVRRTRFRLSSSSRQRLWQRIGSLSRSGVPITEAMEFLHESRTIGDITAGFIEHQRLAIRSGGFSAAAVGWVPKEELIIIEVTQEGDIADGFAQAARIASVRSQLRSTLVAGLTYPTLLLFAGGTVIAVSNVKIDPLLSLKNDALSARAQSSENSPSHLSSVRFLKRQLSAGLNNFATDASINSAAVIFLSPNTVGHPQRTDS